MQQRLSEMDISNGCVADRSRLLYVIWKMELGYAFAVIWKMELGYAAKAIRNG